MTTEQALKTAAGRVNVFYCGPHNYVVNTWSEEHQAWYNGRSMVRGKALHTAWEAKVQIALELFGVEDAGYIANMAAEKDYPMDWRQVVRQEVRRARLVA